MTGGFVRHPMEDAMITPTVRTLFCGFATLATSVVLMSASLAAAV